MQNEKQPGAIPNSASRDLSIEEGSFVDVLGVEQWVTIRGADLNNPVLLIVNGAGAGLSRMAPFFAPWEKDFTLVQWDQPRAGATYAKHGATGVFSFDRIVRDGSVVAEFVRRRLSVSKIILLGISGGTMLGLMMIQRHPDLFAAYVGTGQVVNWARQDALSYQIVVDQARTAGNHDAVAELERIGAPPYGDTATDAIKSKYAGALTPAEQHTLASLNPSVMAMVSAPPPDASYLPRNVVLDDIHTVSMAAYNALREEIVTFDARKLGLQFAVPMFFLQGNLDALTVSSEVQAYAAEVRAPKKLFVPIEGGGHSSYFMLDRFLSLLSTHVRPEALTEN